MPIVSVIVPAYNCESTIIETIVSIQNQTLFDIEIIVINDGSTDNTLDRLMTIQDKRLKILSYENRGLPTARNRGIAHATSPYISFIDADDLWAPDKLELQVAALKSHPNAGVAYSWTICMDNEGKNFYPGVQASYQGNVFSNLLVCNFIASGSNVLLTRQVIDAVGEFDSTLKSCEDWDYWLRVARSWEFVVIPKPQIIYRLSSGAMSSKIDVMEKYQLLVLEKAFTEAPKEYQHLKKQGQSYIYQFLTHLCLTRAKNKGAVLTATKNLWKSINLYPKTLLTLKTQKLAIKLLIAQTRNRVSFR
ncbi:glycosyl transferase [Dulcicalothrix desertica PCC 7102]|uniref:Glycosyl transferase n=1 Tax=Dulcicalothrix desertica PCC 7102 TaxID=232991 RepID=A0A3S1CBZ8_9CYAN|nr:glycosyltransferase family A protein [Dulcicalothrix desertica]RUT04244.1 glycosyl transferase [Dulcicalothrix desertica PCC 7102]TWH51452.1 glycosyltransferase involved in cell wall biosynthesis [Dulcicalothrix desertica PCC 7102]